MATKDALIWHLKSNFYPALPPAALQIAADAIAAYEAGGPGALVDMSKYGPDFHGQKTAGELVDTLALGEFVGGDE